MNSVLQYFRSLDPRFNYVPDDKLLQWAVETDPRFAELPEVKADLASLAKINETEKQNAVVEDPEAQNRGRLATAGMNFMSAGGKSVGQAISGTARTKPFLSLDALPFGYPDIAGGVKRQEERNKLTPAQKEAQVQEDPLYQYGRRVEQGAAEAFQGNPKYKGEFFADVLPSAGGQVLAQAPAVALAGPAGLAAFYSASGSQQVAQEAIDSGHPEKADNAFFANVPVGAATELALAPMAKLKMLKKIAESGKPGATIAKAAIGEAAQEGLEQVSQNAIAKDVVGYDPSRGYGEGVLESMAAGGIVGGAVGGIVHGMQTPQRRQLLKDMTDRAPGPDLSPAAEADALYFAGQRQAASNVPVVDTVNSDATIRNASSESGFAPLPPGAPPSKTIRQPISSEARPVNSQTRRAALEEGMIGEVATETQVARPFQPLPPPTAGLLTKSRGGNVETPIDQLIASDRKEYKIPEAIANAYQGIRASLDLWSSGKPQDADRINTLIEQGPRIKEQLDNRIADASRNGASRQLLDELTSLSNDLAAFNELQSKQAPDNLADEMGAANELSQERRTAEDAERARRQESLARRAVSQKLAESGLGEPPQIATEPSPVDNAIQAAKQAPPKPQTVKLSAEWQDSDSQQIPIQSKPAPAPVPPPASQGQYILMPASALGVKGKGVARTLIGGTVTGVNQDGTMRMKVSRIGNPNGKHATLQGISLGLTMDIPATAHKFLKVTEPPVAPEVEAPRPVTPRTEAAVIDQVVSVINRSAETPVFPAYQALREKMLSKDADLAKQAETDLLALVSKLPPGEQIGLEAAFAQNRARQTVQSIASYKGIDLVDEDTAFERFVVGVRKWAADNLADTTKVEPLKLAPMYANAEMAIRNDFKNNIPPETSLDELTHEPASEEPVKQTESYGSLKDFLSDENRARAASILKQHISGVENNQPGGPKKLDPVRLHNALVGMLRLMEVDPSLQYGDNEIRGLANRIAERISGQYNRHGIDYVAKNIAEGTLLSQLIRKPRGLAADWSETLPVNQNLPVGRMSLRDAVSAAFQHLEDGNPVRQIMDKVAAVAAGVKVNVLLDGEFEALPLANASESPALYDPATGEIFIRQSSLSHDYLVAHEGVHAATITAIKNNTQFRRAVLALRSEAIKALGVDSFYGLQNHGADWRNAAEFVSEAFSKPEFRDQLSGIPSAKEQTLWGKFVNTLAKLFGVDTKHVTLLDQIVDLAMENMAAPELMNEEALGAQDQAASRLITSAKQKNEMTSQPGLSKDNQAFIERAASVYAHMVPDSIVKQFNNIGGVARGALKWIKAQADVSTARIPLSSLPLNTEEEIQQARHISHGVIEFVDSVQESLDMATKAVEDKVKNMSASIQQDMTAMNGAWNEVDFYKSIAKALMGEYIDYVEAERVAYKDNDPGLYKAATQAAEGIRRMRSEFDRIRTSLTIIASAIPSKVLATLNTNQDILNYINSNHVFDQPILDGKVTQAVVDYLTKPDTNGRIPLVNFISLKKSLELMQSIQKDVSVGKKAIKDFEEMWRALQQRKNAKPVSTSDFMAEYGRLMQKNALAFERVRLLSRKIKKASDAIRAASDKKDLLTALVRHPDFKADRKAAVDIIGIVERFSEGNRVGNDVHFYIKDKNGNTPKQPIVLSGVYSPEKVSLKDPKKKDVYKYHVENLKLIEAIKERLQYATDPKEIASLEYALLQHTQLYASISDGAIGMNHFDVVNAVRLYIPVLKGMFSRMYVASRIHGVLGTMLRVSYMRGMQAAKNIEAVKNNSVYGDFMVNLTQARAIRSHAGLSPNVWDKQVLNELLGSWQIRTGVNHQVGWKNKYGHIYTKEDLEAARIQAAYANGLYKAVEGAAKDGVLYYFPTLIQDGNNFRKSYSAGGLTTPRTFDRSKRIGSPFEIANAWWVTMKMEDPTARRSSQLELLNKDPFTFRELIMSYVEELNTEEFSRTSKNEDAYLSLTHEWLTEKKSRPTSFDELVSQIAEVNKRTEADIANDLLSETSKWVDAYIADFNGGNRMSEELLKRFELGTDRINLSVDSDNSFTVPRGQMVAPSNFYTYTLSSDAARGALRNNAMLPIRLDQLSKIAKVKQALMDARDQIGADVKEYRSKTPLGVRAMDYVMMRQPGSRKKVLAGEIYATAQYLNRTISMLGFNQEALLRMVEKPLIEGERGLGRELLDARRLGLVAAPVAAFNNYSSATLVGRVIPQLFLQGRQANALGSSVGNIVTFAFNSLAVISKEIPAMRKWAEKNRGTIIPILKRYANTIHEMAKLETTAQMRDWGRNQLSWIEQAKIIREVGSQSSLVTSENDWRGEVMHVADKIFSSWIFPRVTSAIKAVPVTADYLANINNLRVADKVLTTVMRAGLKVMDARDQVGTKGWDDWNNPYNAISDAEAEMMGVSPESFVRLKMTFGMIGGLERNLHSYWLRVKEAERAGKPIGDIPPIADEGFYKNITSYMLGLVNAPMDSMRHELTKSNTTTAFITDFLFTFHSWMAAFLENVGQTKGVENNNQLMYGVYRSAWTYMGIMIALALAGIEYNEIRGWLTEMIKGRPYSLVTIGDVANDPTGGNVSKLIGTGLAGVIPYAGEYIAMAMGSQNYRANLMDISNLSQGLQLSTLLYNTLDYGFKTGDWTGGMTRFTRTMVPGTDILINHLPIGREMDALNDAARIARRNSGDLEVANRSGSGGAPTEFSTLVRKAVGASATGDMNKAKEYLKQAAEVKGGSDPWGAVMSSVNAQMPDNKTFGRRLTPEESASLTGRMGGSLATYQRGVDAITRLQGMIRTMKPAAASAVPKGPFDQLQKTFSRISKAQQPKAMQKIKQQLSRYKMPKIKRAGRSVLPQQARLGRVGAGLSPSVLRMQAV